MAKVEMPETKDQADDLSENTDFENEPNGMDTGRETEGSANIKGLSRTTMTLQSLSEGEAELSPFVSIGEREKETDQEPGPSSGDVRPASSLSNTSESYGVSWFNVISEHTSSNPAHENRMSPRDMSQGHLITQHSAQQDLKVFLSSRYGIEVKVNKVTSPNLARLKKDDELAFSILRNAMDGSDLKSIHQALEHVSEMIPKRFLNTRKIDKLWKDINAFSLEKHPDIWWFPARKYVRIFGYILDGTYLYKRTNGYTVGKRVRCDLVALYNVCRDLEDDDIAQLLNVLYQNSEENYTFTEDERDLPDEDPT